MTHLGLACDTLRIAPGNKTDLGTALEPKLFRVPHVHDHEVLGEHLQRPVVQDRPGLGVEVHLVRDHGERVLLVGFLDICAGWGLGRDVLQGAGEELAGLAILPG